MKRKPKVITISGEARHGKDTLGKILKEQLEAREQKVLTLAFADYVKFVCSKYFGASNERNDETRAMWQKVGTDIVRARDEQFWVGIVDDLMTVLAPDYDYYIITDARFPNEIQSLKFWGWDVTSIHVRRYNFTSELKKEHKEHISERALEGFEFDINIVADSVKDLEDKAIVWLENKIMPH